MTWPWLVALLGCMAFMYAAGRLDWLRTGRRQVWGEARAHFDAEKRSLMAQLDSYKRELPRCREVETADGRDLGPSDNGAAYRSAVSPSNTNRWPVRSRPDPAAACTKSSRGGTHGAH